MCLCVCVCVCVCHNGMYKLKKKCFASPHNPSALNWEWFCEKLRRVYYISYRYVKARSARAFNQTLIAPTVH
jgi:hypothetical protein